MARFPPWRADRDGAQGRTKLEAPFRQAEARVQRERSRVGARRTRALCIHGHGDMSHGLPPAPAGHWMRSETHNVAGETWVGAAPMLCRREHFNREESTSRVIRPREDGQFSGLVAWPALG